MAEACLDLRASSSTDRNTLTCFDTRRTLIVGLIAAAMALATTSMGGSESLPAARVGEAEAEATSGGGPEASTPRLGFVGAAASTDPVGVLGDQTIRLLFAFREPATLDQVLDRGIAFDSRRIVELVEWGLLEQSGMEFHARIPILLEGEAEAFRARLQTHVELISDDLGPLFRRLSYVVDREIGELAMPAVVTWILQERAWHYLVEDGTVPIAALVRSQRAAYPNRGWWGVFCHIEPPVRRVHELNAFRTRDRVLQLVWPWGQPPSVFAGNRGRALAGQFLALIEGDGRRVDDIDMFQELVALGIVGPDGTLRARMREWRPDDPESVAFAVESTAREAARVFAPSLSPSELAPDGGDPVAMAVLAYMELVPAVLRELDRDGMSVMLAPESDTGEATSVAGGSAEGGRAGRDGNGGGPSLLSTLSLIAWDEFPAERPGAPEYPLPW